MIPLLPLLDTTAGVFHLRSPLGQYKLTFDKAREACTKEAATMATYNQLSYAQKVGPSWRALCRQGLQGRRCSFLLTQGRLTQAVAFLERGVQGAPGAITIRHVHWESAACQAQCGVLP